MEALIKSSVFLIKYHLGVLNPDFSAISFSFDLICADRKTLLLGITEVLFAKSSSVFEGMFSNSDVAQTTLFETVQ